MTSARFILILFLYATLTSSYGLADSEPPIKIAQKNKKKRAGILRLYKKATLLYDKQRYDEAISIYTRILKTYPSHEPSRIYLAKSLYRLGRHTQAYKMFSQINLDSLDPETSYEYGHSHFRKKRYGEALQGFKRVPNGHPLFDLASYYGGVCALRLKKFPESVSLFDQSVVLPSKLMKNKKTLQKQAEDMMLLEQRKQLESNKKEPPPRETPEKVSQVRPEKKKQKGKGSQSKSEGFLKSQTLAGLRVITDMQEQEFSDVSSKSSSRIQIGLMAETGKDLKFGSSKKGSHFHVHLEAEYNSIDQDTPSISITKDYEEDLEILLTNTNQLTSLAKLDLTLAPEWDIGNNSWIGTGVSYLHYSYSGASGSTSSMPVVFVQLGQINPNYSILLSGRMITVNIEQGQYLERTDESLDISTFIGRSLKLDLSGLLSQFSYRQNSTDGPDWLARLKATAIYEFTNSVAIGFTGHFEQLGGNRLHNIGGLEVVGFEQDNLGGGVTMNLKPFSWLEIDLTGQFHDRKVADIEPNTNEAKLAVSEAFATYTTSISGTITAQYSF